MNMEKVHQWIVKDISSKLAASSGGCFSAESRKFSLGADGVSNWKLILRKERRGHEDKRYLKIYLVNCRLGLTGQTVIDKEQFHLRVERNDSSNVVIQGSPGSTFSYDNGDIGYVWDDILQFWKQESCAIEEFLRGSVIITIMLKKKTATDSIAKTLPTEATGDIYVKRIKQGELEGMIAKLENDEKNSDVKIISADGQEFYAYRWILAEVSDVFEAMFRSDMTEKETGVVKFEDLSGATVKLLLHFIYTRKIGQKWCTSGIVKELVYAAEKYQIEDLKEFLDANLGKVCTAENAGNLFILAEKTSMKKAVEDIFSFIKGNDSKGFFEILKNTKMN